MKLHSLLKGVVATTLIIPWLAGCSFVKNAAQPAEPATTTAEEAKVPLTPSSVSGKVEGKKVKYKVSYDRKKWELSQEKFGQDSEYELVHKDGDVYAMVIPERIQIPLETLKRAALQNAQAADPNAAITSEEKRMVNGKEVLVMKISATIEEIPFRYYGYYYAGKQGSIQFLSYTSDNLFDQYEQDLEELLNGLKIED